MSKLVPILIVTALLAIFAASTYFGAAPTPATTEEISANPSPPAEDAAAATNDAPTAQKFIPIAGFDASSDIASRPYYPHYHKFNAMSYMDRRIEMPRVGIKLDDANLEQLQKAILSIDLGYKNIPTAIKAVWTGGNARDNDYSVASFAEFDLTPAQKQETIGSTIIVTADSTTGLAHASHSTRIASFKIPADLPRAEGLDGALRFTVTGTYATRSNNSVSGFRKFKFEETYEIGWRIVEDAYLIFTPKIKNTDANNTETGDQSGNRHPGKDFVVLPNGNFYFIDGPDLFGPFSKILRPEISDQAALVESEKRYNVPYDLKYGYSGWGFYDEPKNGWMIVAPVSADGEIRDDTSGRLIGPFDAIGSAGISSSRNVGVWFDYQDGDRLRSYNNGGSSPPG